MIQNILLISLIIVLIFFMSNETKMNDLVMRNYIKYLLPIFIIYFVYQNYNLSILVVVLLVIIFLNIDIGDKLNNNIYLSKLKEGFSKFTNIENFSNVYDIKNLSFEIKSEEEKKDTEPFKNEVMNIKELYENIRSEINKLSK